MLNSRLILIITLFVSQAATAALGDRESVISSDQVRLKAASHSKSTVSGVNVHEMVSPIRTVKEFVNADGLVFAVSWKGIKPPNLSVVLGSYYQEFATENAKRARAVTRQPTEVQTPNIIVRKGGHMRALTGKAYVKALLPAGFNVGDLK
jgi:hypothetical protein